MIGWWLRSVSRQTEMEALLRQLRSKDAGTALAAVGRLSLDHRLDPDAIYQQLSHRGEQYDLFEDGPAAVEEDLRSRAVLSAAEVILPVAEASPEDLRMLALVVWALDRFPGRDPSLADRSRQVCEAVLRPLRRLRPPPRSPPAGDPEWRDIPAGRFEMGSAEGGDDDERPLHRVTISAFRLLDHEVTVTEYRRLVPDHRPTMGRSPFTTREEAAGGPEGPEEQLLLYPAVNLSWYEAYAYAAWLGGRLPTEGEWEYAAQAECGYEYCDRDGGRAELGEVGWYSGNSGRELRPVKGLEPNPWGLYDMYGNAWEWVGDWFGAYGGEPQVDPWGPPGGSSRVVRGGSAWLGAVRARAAYRFVGVPGNWFGDLGFRVLLPAAPSS
jgi:formylglycine-generating enzyme required for sulfatase activity